MIYVLNGARKLNRNFRDVGAAVYIRANDKTWGSQYARRKQDHRKQR